MRTSAGQLLPLLLPFLVGTSRAVYSDEAFKTDYHIPLLGTPSSHLNTFFHRPSKSGPASLLYSLSQQCVLGAVNPKDGSLVWRQQLLPPLSDSTTSTTNHNNNGKNDKNNKNGCILRRGPNGFVATGADGEVSYWDASSGRQVWANNFDKNLKDIVVLETEDIVVAAFGDGTVRGLSGKDGDVRWETLVGEGKDIPLSFTNEPTKLHLALEIPASQKLKTVSISHKTGAILETHIPDSFDSVVGYLQGPAYLPVVGWNDGKSIRLHVLGTKSVVPIPETGHGVETTLLAASPQQLVLAHSDKTSTHPKSSAEVYSVASGVKKTLDFPSENSHSCFSLSQTGQGAFLTRVTESQLSVYSIDNATPIQSFKFARKLSSQPQHCVSEVVKRMDGSLAARTSVFLANGNHVLLRNGDITWTREESLASALTAEWVELRDTEEGLERELHAEDSKNIVGAYVHRVTRHINELQYLLPWLQTLPQKIMASFGVGPAQEDRVLTGDMRDAFGFRKLVVFITAFGEAVATDTYNRGAVVWRLDLGTGPLEKTNVVGLYIICRGFLALLLRDGRVLQFDAVAGKMDKVEQLAGAAEVDSAASIETGEQSGILVLPKSGGSKGWIFPTSADFQDALSNTWLTQRTDNGVRGIKPKLSGSTYQFDIQPSWEFNAPPDEILVSLATRPALDPVASVGKVLGDRSVMYKYLNPHLLLVITKKPSANSISLYLLDSVSGYVLYSAKYKDVDTTQPIVSTVSENWFVVSFLSTSAARGYHLVVSELYASALKNDPGPLASSDGERNASSFDVSRSGLPHVISQAYLFTSPISAMKTTITRQGITTRSVLLSLPSLGSLLAVPKRVLDPNRPIGREPNNDEKEEGLFKYDPLIGIDWARGVLSHSREVLGMDTIMTSPTLLESTCIVMGWGLDLFGTRISPSEPFDILGKAFNKVALVGTVLALGVGTSFLRPMVRKKQINQRWKQ